MASAIQNAPLAQSLGPRGGGIPFWGLNDAGVSANEAPTFFDGWDTAWIGTRQLPGICKVNPGGIAQLEINRKKGKGFDGARLTAVGYDPKGFSVSTEIETAEQWSELQDIVDVYWRIPGKTSNLSDIAVSVFHYNLGWLKVYQAVLSGISPLVDGSRDGSKIATFNFQESNPPKPKNVTKSAKGVGVPISARRPGVDPVNSTPNSPSSNAANMSLDGPVPFSPPGAQ